MDLLGLLKRIEWGSESVCPECDTWKWNIKSVDVCDHDKDCQLKAAIDALEADRLAVMEIGAYNTRRVIRAMRLEKERKEKEQGT